MLIFAIAMSVISIFMAISYHLKIEAGTADGLTKVAYYVWICSIPVWLVSTIYHFRKLRNYKT